MKYKNPHITIILPVYNSEEYVSQSIISILNQTFIDYEIIIIDDSSTDKSWQIVQSFTDGRLISLRNCQNLGNYPSRNRGISLAKGKYIAIMDSDDIALPDRLMKQYNYLENNPDVLAVGTQFNSLGMDFKKVNPVSYHDICAGLLDNNCILHPSLLIKKSAILELKAYNEKYIYASDYDLVCRLSLVGKIENLPDYCMLYRWHQQQISNSKKRQQKEFADEIRQNYQINLINKYNDKKIYKIGEEETGYKDMGRIIGLYVMGRAINEDYEDEANHLLDTLFENTTEEIPVCIKNGLLGIGMGLIYLIRNQFIFGDEDEILEDIDHTVFKSILFYGTNKDFDWKGHFSYLLKRLTNYVHEMSLLVNLNLKYYLLLLILAYERSKQNISLEVQYSISEKLITLKNTTLYKDIIGEIDEKEKTYACHNTAINTNVTFVIPVRIDSNERFTNLMVVIDHLQLVENSEIILLEADLYPKISKDQLPEKVKHNFFEDNDPIFYRTKYINKLLDFSNNKIVGIWDTDVIVPLDQIKESIRQLSETETIFSLPYDGRFYNLSIDDSESFREKRDFGFIGNPDSLQLSFGCYSFGGAFFVNKEVYKKIGGENENFYGWGPEDLERVMRVRNFGYTICRTEGPLYHLYHPRNNSNYPTSDFKNKSLQELITISNMSHTEIEMYVNSWNK